MTYVFDTNSISNILSHYYPERFPTFWEKFYGFIQAEEIISVREAKFELATRFEADVLTLLTNFNSSFFREPTTAELTFVREIYAVRHFQQNLERKKLLAGGSFADPFIIAKASVLNGTVITEEEYRDNAVKIPNICNHFQIPWTNLEGFLTQEDWKF
ncbi:MAG: DUF4411 family protein [Candidatus Marinimicrobia bacterium]|nr:DUF4411 family protein [Candidatus Neomarinimicrobiota bacterium]